ncbi:hypothetical protein [Pseudogemmobacter humi]|uniref:Uncharacterized protein n=1 Tax=Pseudogemmobacter humi TaxID=2483812 RepID=A0A3P5WU51_9RHOB|nr:hypothetical protein [Pseudogemmobacter humi]VDC25235.1 hypothetical protein XINFAN_01473 [Pseudogemmobacter humi]
MLRLLITLCLAAAPVRADEPAPPGPVTTLAHALALYERASAQGEALEMAVAVRLAHGIGLREATRWTRETDKIPAAETPGRSHAVTLDLLLSDAAWAGALLMAEEDELMAEVLATLPPPGRQGSASRMRADLPAARQDLWQIPLAGQSPAEIAVFPARAGGQPRILWRVEDSGGETVCPPREAGFTACRFTPAANGFYRVVIANPSGESGEYLLLSN